MEALSIPRINARHWHRENHIRTQPSSSSLIDKLIFAREEEAEESNIFLLFHFFPPALSRMNSIHCADSPIRLSLPCREEEEGDLQAGDS